MLTGLPVVWGTLRGVAAGRFAADLVAMLAIVTALLLGQPLAGLIVVLMQTGGEALERYAEGRASEAVRELEAAAPRLAHRVSGDDVEDVSAEAIAVGDTLLLRPGELIPSDAVVLEGRSHVDASRLTGEPIPVSARPGTTLLSGSLNLEGALTVRATAPARQSQYAKIVELVRTAQASKSPLQRLADRYAVWFTPATLLVCLLAYVMSGDPLRVLAVLVVATPCPLILATPVAVVGGINRAARHGIIFRHGAGLEQLGGVTAAVFDKTGTLTLGRPEVARVLASPPWTPTRVLRIGGAVSSTARVTCSPGHWWMRPRPEGSRRPRRATSPKRPGRACGAGSRAATSRWAGGALWWAGARSAAAVFQRLLESSRAEELRAFVTVDGQAAGIVEYADQLRPGMRPFIERLRRLGIRRVLLLSGDSEANAAAVAPRSRHRRGLTAISSPKPRWRPSIA